MAKEVGIASGDSTTVKNGAVIGPATGYNLISSLRTIGIQFTTKNRLKQIDVSHIGIMLTEAGISSIDAYAVKKPKCRIPIPRYDPSAPVGSINALSHKDFDCLLSSVSIGYSILEEDIGIDPTGAVIRAGGIGVHVDYLRIAE
jgi:hypothetical protein